MRTLLLRGMLAGLAGGVLYALFAYLFGEPSVDSAIAYEEQAAAAAGEVDGEEPLVSRAVQSTIGLTVAALVYGTAVGGIFALVFAAVQGRVGRLSPRATAAVLALLAFVVVCLVPFLKYPANPPASSIDETIGQRTGLYVVMVLLSVAVAVAAVVLRERLIARLGAWNATLVAAAAYIVVIGVVIALLPVIAETPADFPASLLYEFRMASLGGQLVLWTTVGLVFGALVDRSGQTTGRAERRSVDVG